MCFLQTTFPPPSWHFSHQAALGLDLPWAELMEGPENLPQAKHSGGSHWLEPAKSGRGRSLGESEEGGKQDEGGVCVRGGGISVQKAAKWQLTLLNINHLCFCNFGNASRPTTAEYFINTTHFQLHFSHFSFSRGPLSHPCPPSRCPAIAAPAMATMPILSPGTLSSPVVSTSPALVHPQPTERGVCAGRERRGC